MLSPVVKLIAGLIGTTLLAVFVIGLTHSIATGFAGFWGGFPCAVIVFIVLSMALYDFWDECVRRK